MNDFMNAYQDFMKHSEIDWNQKQQEAKKYAEMFYEQKAAELEITVDYYMQEFI
jgi:hypothetical protein